MYSVVVAPRAQKQLKNIERENQKISVALIIEDFQHDPYVGKKLSRDLRGRYAYRAGVYRIIYKIYEKEKIVEIISAGHRAAVY